MPGAIPNCYTQSDRHQEDAFIDILYKLIRFENRDVYAFITYAINNFSNEFIFDRNKVKKLLKKLNRLVNAVVEFEKDRQYQIGTHTLLEGINFGFYKEREKVYAEVNSYDRAL